jgi:hypothetical protein
MAEPPLGDPMLERALIELGRQVAYPPTPALASAVRRRLLAQAEERASRPWTRWLSPPPSARVRAAALIVLVAVAAALALSPGVRRVVADRLGLRGLPMRFLPAAPTAAPTARPEATPLGARLGLGRRVSLGEAQAELPYTVRQPVLLGAPDEVYLPSHNPNHAVHLVYHSRSGLPATDQTGVGLLFTQFVGTDLGPELGKGIPPGTAIESVRVNGQPGYWIEGEPHLLLGFRDAQGDDDIDEGRLAGNTLAWVDGTLTLRLEMAADQAAALRLAESLR